MSAHTHPDPSVLVSACPACIERVQRDQEDARWSEAPVRKVTFVVRTRYATASELVLSRPVPADVTHPEIIARYAGDVAAFFGCDLADPIKSVIVGPVVEPVAVAEPDVPSLFEALS